MLLITAELSLTGRRGPWQLDKDFLVFSIMISAASLTIYSSDKGPASSGSSGQSDKQTTPAAGTWMVCCTTSKLDRVARWVAGLAVVT